MRAIKRTDSLTFDGQRTYRDYIRPHTALNGKTPAEAAGIKINGENKWLELIRKTVDKTHGEE